MPDVDAVSSHERMSRENDQFSRDLGSSRFNALMESMDKLTSTVNSMQSQVARLEHKVTDLENNASNNASPVGISANSVASTSRTTPDATSSTATLSKGMVQDNIYRPYKPQPPQSPLWFNAMKKGQNYGPPAPKLPVFDGGHNWNTFLFQFERVAKKYDWEDEEKATRLGESFTGDALDYYSSLPEQVLSDYESLKCRMSSAFGQKDSQAVVRRKLQELKQGPEETVEEFSRRTWKLASGAYINFKEEDIEILAVDAFLKGCKEKAASLVAMNQEPKTLDQALHAVLITVQNQRIINGAPKAQIR